MHAAAYHDERSRQLTSSVINGTVITSTLHLIPADSPILVSGVLDIRSGGSLVVSAGTTLVFDTPSSGIIVNSGGQLLITGTLDNRVVLKAHDDEDSWNGIVFETGAVPTIFNGGTYTSGSTIQYADIVRAGYSSSYVSSVGLSLEEGIVPYLLGVDMIDCGGRYYGRAIYILNLQSFAVIRNLRVLQSNETQTYYPRYPIQVNGNGANAGHLTVENVVVEANSRYDSLYINSINYVTVLRSIFEESVSLSSIGEAAVNENIVADSLSLSSVGALDLSGNSINNGLDISYLTSSTPSFVVDNIISGRRLYYYQYSYYSNSNVTISANIIKESSMGGMYIYNEGGGVVNVKNNTIEQCKSTYYAVIDLISRSGSRLHFTNNSIVNNEGDHVLQITGSSDYEVNFDLFSENIAYGNSASDSFIRLYSYPWSNFTRNVFENNTAPISVEIDISSSYEKLTVELPLNYWGAFQSDIIDLRTSVVDGLVTASQPLVNFVSVLTSPSFER